MRGESVTFYCSGARVTVEMARGEFFRQDGGSSEEVGLEEEEGVCVYLGGLPAACTENDIDMFFNGYGRLNLVVMRNHHGFAFIEEERDAREAVKELKGRKILGEEVVLELLERDEANSVKFPRYRLKIENLPKNTGAKVILTSDVESYGFNRRERGDELILEYWL